MGHVGESCLSTSDTVQTAVDCLNREGRIFSLLTHGNHSHHYQKRQAFSYEDGVFVVRIFICVGNSIESAHFSEDTR